MYRNIILETICSKRVNAIEVSGNVHEAFSYYYCIYGRKGCCHPLTPISTILKLFKHKVIFREKIKLKYWVFLWESITFSWLLHFALILLALCFEDEIVLIWQTLPDQMRRIQIFTSMKQSHSTSYCLHEYKSSEMSCKWKLCLDCWFCLCGCGCASKMWNEM